MNSADYAPKSYHNESSLVTSMPPRVLSRAEVRDIDRRAIEEYGLPGLVLMENAGRGVAELLLKLGISGPVTICAGKGNNGGDGFVIARHLDLHGISVKILLFCEPVDLTGDAAVNYQVARKADLTIQVFGCNPNPEAVSATLTGSDWIVDALLGTGTQGMIREPFVTAINAINQASARVLAVDLPSGLDCDTGKPLGSCVRADHSATFVAKKSGFNTPDTIEFTGIIHVISIGAPRKLLESLVPTAPKPPERVD